VSPLTASTLNKRNGEKSLSHFPSAATRVFLKQQHI
jgi:hypothetical protein